ncbi:MAG: LytR C-terminal domain-containing protein [Candidatus Roizmanbacteria bacterium]|nr:LytR C-terminal domain-containing protein [Candidatus Roizmanbacteria bacterium]
MPTKPVKKKTDKEKVSETTKTASKPAVKKPVVPAETPEVATVTTPPIDTRLSPAPETTPEVTTVQTPVMTTVPADSAADTSIPAATPVSSEVTTPTDEATPPSGTETDDDVFGEESSGGSGMKYFLIFLAALIIGALIVGGYFYYQSQTSSDESPESEQQEPTPETVQEATEGAGMTEEGTDEGESQSDMDLSEYQVQILNGSGIAGQAGAVQELLEAGGFEQFETGNADSFDFTDTEVRMKEEVPADVFTSIMDSLEEYTVVEGDVLDEDADYDIVITVGQKS